MNPTREELINNPGGIDRHDDTLWQGMAQDQHIDSRFVVFTTPFYGIRALAIVLLNYYRKHNLKTVQQIIDRWAPPSENNTGAYVNHVAALLGVGTDAPLNVESPDCLEVLVRAIITHENGRCIYDDATLINAVKAAIV